VDGIFCSHLLEHLPFERVVRLIELIVTRLQPGGVLGLVFPNPGSIRLHLFGFWRDPEHVRFYNGDLIASVCRHYGFKLEYSNQEEEPNRLEVPRLEHPSLPPPDKGWRGHLLGGGDRLDHFLQEFQNQVAMFNQKMERFAESLNTIWSKADEVVLFFRKESVEI
jgi:SAM-dependent methyltransferase